MAGRYALEHISQMRYSIKKLWKCVRSFASAGQGGPGGSHPVAGARLALATRLAAAPSHLLCCTPQQVQAGVRVSHMRADVSHATELAPELVKALTSGAMSAS